MASDTAALVVALSAQLTKFEKDMKDAYGIADKQTKAIEKRFEKMNQEISTQISGIVQAGANQFGALGGILTKIGPVGLTIAAGLGAATLAFSFLNREVQEFVTKAGKLRDASDTTGLTIDQLKELGRVGLEVGVS